MYRLVGGKGRSSDGCGGIKGYSPIGTVICNGEGLEVLPRSMIETANVLNCYS